MSQDPGTDSAVMACKNEVCIFCIRTGGFLSSRILFIDHRGKGVAQVFSRFCLTLHTSPLPTPCPGLLPPPADMRTSRHSLLPAGGIPSSHLLPDRQQAPNLPRPLPDGFIGALSQPNIHHNIQRRPHGAAVGVAPFCSHCASSWVRFPKVANVLPDSPVLRGSSDTTPPQSRHTGIPCGSKLHHLPGRDVLIGPP